MRVRGVWLAILLVGCGDSTSESESESGTASAAATTEDGTASTTTPATTTSSGSDSEGPGTDTATDTAPTPSSLARGGIRIAAVTLNQGIEIPIGLGGEGVPGEERVGYVVFERETLVRAYWDQLPADWTPRELLGRLELTPPDGDPVVLEDVEMVQGLSQPGDLETTFTWEPDPALLVPSVEYRVELWELDPELAVGPEPDPPPATPHEGTYPVGVESSPHEIKMVVVPVRHQLNGCDNPIDLPDSELEVYARALEQLYPVQFADVSGHEEFLYTESIGTEPDYSKLLTALSQLRAADDPDPNVIYYGVVISCDGGPGGVAGQAFSIPPPLKSAANQRVAVGNFIGGADTSAIIMVHEFGHALGRRHVFCNGEGNTDPDFPHNLGATSVWGWGIHDGVLYDPAERKDYMTYCFTYWVSDYGWNLTFELTGTLTSWDYEYGSGSTGDRALQGALYPDGTSDWWIARGGAGPGFGARDGSVTLYSKDGAVYQVPAWTERRPDSETLSVVAPVPNGLEPATHAAWARADGAADSFAITPLTGATR